MRIFYYLSSCDTCKRIAKELSIDDTVSQIDIKKNPITNSQLEVLYQITGSYEDLVNKRAQLFKQNNLKDQNLNEEAYRALLLEHYTFLKRPVLLHDKIIFIGNSAKTVTAAKTFLDEQ
jgi:arsenate reductase